MPKSRKITRGLLKEDEKVRDEMDRLSEEGKKDTKEYKDLFRKYYINNDDVRIYWKTY